MFFHPDLAPQFLNVRFLSQGTGCIDIENVADHIGFTPSSELVYVDVFPDWSPCCVASHGLPSFLQSSSRRPLIQRGVTRFDSNVEIVASAPSVSSPSSSTPDAVDRYMKRIPLMPVFKGCIPEHRDFHPILGAIEACVARPVSKKERLETPMLGHPLIRSGTD